MWDMGCAEMAKVVQSWYEVYEAGEGGEGGKGGKGGGLVKSSYKLISN